MLDLALAPVLLVALGGILFGVRYMRREAYLPYHAEVVGKSWNELDPETSPWETRVKLES